MVFLIHKPRSTDIYLPPLRPGRTHLAAEPLNYLPQQATYLVPLHPKLKFYHQDYQHGEHANNRHA